jgi:hypothetical protein
MIGGSPSFERRRLIAIFTAPVNGSAASSQTPREKLLGRHDPSVGGEQQLDHADLLRRERQLSAAAETRGAARCRPRGRRS